MTDPSPARPLPGPSRPGPGSAGSSPAGNAADRRSIPAAEPSPTAGDGRPDAPSFEDLEQRPVAEHVGVFETEHARLQRELGTIDQL